MSTDLFTLTLYHFDDIMPSREAAGLSSIFMVNIKKESLPFGKLSSTRKRYSTLCSTPSLAEAKHTRSSYSSRDDRQSYQLCS